jgi:hypothetical protein
MTTADSGEMAADMSPGVALAAFLQEHRRVAAWDCWRARLNLLSCWRIAGGIDPRIHLLA